MQAKLKVLFTGPSASVQDKGRYGHMRFGVSGSGAMDRSALLIANAALENPESNPVLEISLGGITLECTEGSISIAIAGGAFNSTLNSTTLPAWTALSISAGDILQVKPGEWGSWCYLAFAGQIDSTRWLNSQSVHLNSGVCGKPLEQNDVISIRDAQVTVKEPASLADPESLRPQSDVRVVIGPQERFFEKSTLEKLFNTDLTISADYNRMGMRLTGCTLPVSATLDMPSEPISRGSLQVPGHGDPICLLADHHTAGGYPKIATIVSADQDKLVQHRSGETIRFVSITPAQAVQAARDRALYMAQLLEQIKRNKVSVTERLWSSNLISGAFSEQEN